MKHLFLSSAFSMVGPLFEKYLQERELIKTVTFLDTASHPESIKSYVKAARKTFERVGVIVENLDVASASSEQIETVLNRNEMIYISGGNTFYLLQELKKKNADKIISDLIGQGKTYIGESAGSIILAPDIEYIHYMDDKAKAPELQNFKSLHEIDFFPVPHQGNFPFKRSVERIMEAYRRELNLYPFNNSQVIIVHGEDVQLHSIR